MKEEFIKGISCVIQKTKGDLSFRIYKQPNIISEKRMETHTKYSLLYRVCKVKYYYHSTS